MGFGSVLSEELAKLEMEKYQKFHTLVSHFSITLFFIEMIFEALDLLERLSDLKWFHKSLGLAIVLSVLFQKIFF